MLFDIRLLDGEHTLWNRDLYAPSKRRKVAATACVGYSAKLNAVGLYKVYVNHQGRVVAASCAEVRAFDDSQVEVSGSGVVYAFDRARVVASGNIVVYAHDQSVIEARDNAVIVLQHSVITRRSQAVVDVVSPHVVVIDRQPSANIHLRGAAIPARRKEAAQA